MKNFFKFIVLISLISQTVLAQDTKPKKLLFVLTSHDVLGNTNKKTGFWIEEFATPYYFFKDKGYDIVVATPKGGQAPIDPKSNEPAFQTSATKRYFADSPTQMILSKTVKLASVNQKDFDAVFYPGGHGPMWDLVNDKASISLIQDFYNHQKPIAFVCHGSAALVNTKDKNGKYLIEGKKITGFCNSEEEAVQLTKVVPFALESKLKERGAIYEKGTDWSAFAVNDGLILTGQNPQSSELVAEKLLDLLTKKNLK